MDSQTNQVAMRNRRWTPVNCGCLLAGSVVLLAWAVSYRGTAARPRGVTQVSESFASALDRIPRGSDVYGARFQTSSISWRSCRGCLHLYYFQYPSSSPISVVGPDEWSPFSIRGYFTLAAKSQLTGPLTLRYTTSKTGFLWAHDELSTPFSDRLASRSVGHFAICVIPFWGLFAACVLPPIVRLYFIRRRGRLRRKRGLCSCCGYDLRFANVDCPECGSRAFPTLSLKIE
jgi:hypothetical protein